MAANNILIQVGQCGNQIGRDFCNFIENDNDDSTSSMSHIYQHYDKKLRCLCVDSEPKVISNLLNKYEKSYRKKNIFSGRSGCGANWALGYHGFQNVIGPSFIDDFLNALRKEVERCDSYMGCIMLHSTCGGTGSGLGSRICEAIREEYPINYILSVGVSPHRSGESPLQCYNSMLSLSYLQNYSDGIILYENDDVINRIMSLRSKSESSKAVSLEAMNSYIARSLAGIISPLSSPKSNVASCVFPGREPWEMLQTTCPMPILKFTGIKYLSKGVAWDSLVRNYVQTNCRPKSGTVLDSISCLAVARGDRDHSFFNFMPRLNENLKAAYRCVNWNPFPIDYWTAEKDCSRSASSGSRTLYVCSNSCGVIDYFDHILSKTSTMYEAKAFLHWYWKYGCCEDDFCEARETLQSVALNYRDTLKQ
ncbi:uncharacterized protein TRIADDRAFT_54235 [Trichoplax adhaerens]|uniref:Tubulin delta chain n=1 Tax=Trichoplax adhaerens TaxID=10228 RepID=B3RRH1_TRIAD|nr:hypothetical protein TRIADDRAFT_54235 [Trichoplax adhaerens]EDV26875.1 hypothetical protein TRIADDRAFT_54235 [Trichoplax adhaerens]|eukprot:XP_002110871.1 hypothetical protein TRIADDRAFT_54235 [Trichoplax adhaerens]